MAKQGINPFRGRPIPKTAIQGAIDKTLSMRAAARECNVAYNTFKKYAQRYDLWKTNQSGVGIPRDGSGRFGIYLDDIFDGKHPNYPHWKLQDKLTRKGYLLQQCSNCGYDEYRMSDSRSPLLLDFMDGDMHNMKLDNLRLLCYNCYYVLKDGGTPKNSPKNVNRLRSSIQKAFSKQEE